MKPKYIIIGIIVLALLLGGILFFVLNKNVKVEDIESFSFSYSTSTSMNGNVRYELNKIDDDYEAFVKPNEVAEEDGKRIEVDDKFVESVLEILNKYNVGGWDGFNKADTNVLDGDSFSTYIRMSNKKTISASGYMKYPENYGNVQGELDDLFMNIYNSKTGGNK